MTFSTVADFPRRRRAPFLCLLLLLSIIFRPLLGAADSKIFFEIPADKAEYSLKRLSEQSGVEVLFPTDIVTGIRTNAIKGEMTPKEALDAMLSGTGLVAVVGKATGSLTVRKEAEGEKKRESRRTPSESNQTADNAMPQIMEGVEVTATKDAGVIKQGVIPRTENQTLEYIVLDQQAIERSGATNIADLFQRMVPQNADYGTALQSNVVSSKSTGGLGGPQSEVINLRGIGDSNNDNQTVVLVNGRRTYGGQGQPGDVSWIPLAAIDHIEILPGSGSALYGADATGGIVDIILRKNYSGTEITEQFGISSRGDAAEDVFSVVSGWNSKDGKTSVMLSASFSKSSELTAGQRPFAVRELNLIPVNSPLLFAGFLPAFNAITLPAFGQAPATIYTSSPTGLGIPGDPTAQYAIIPAGTSNTSTLTPASFSGTAGTVNVSPSGRSANVPLLPALESLGVNAEINHIFVPHVLEFYSELGFSYEPQKFSDQNFFGVFNLGPSNPLNPFRTGVTPGFAGIPITVYLDPVDTPPTLKEGIKRVFRDVEGFKGNYEIAGRDWQWALDASIEVDLTRGMINDFGGTAFYLFHNGLYNPLLDITQHPNSASVIDSTYLHIDNFTSSEVFAVNFTTKGDVWQLPAGWSRLSLIGEERWEFYYQSIKDTNMGYYGLVSGNDISPDSVSVTDVLRKATSGAMEATIPLMSEKWNLAGIHGLDLTFAARDERYSDFKGEWDFSEAVKFAPTKDIAFRASLSDAYDPPTTDQLYAAQSINTINGYAIDYDPLRGGEPVPAGNNSVTELSGGNPNLKAETSYTSNVGIIITPRFAKGLTLTVDYWNLHRLDAVLDSNLDTLFIENPALFSDRLTRGPLTAADLANGYSAGQITSIDVRPINLSGLITKGWDLNVRWRLPWLAYGNWDFNAQATYVLTYAAKLTPVSPAIDENNYTGLLEEPPVDFKGNASIYWSGGRWTAGLTARYINKFQTDSTAPTAANALLNNGDFDGNYIASSTEFDVDLGYAIPYEAGTKTGWETWLQGTRFSLRVNNAFDREPPYITDQTGFYSRFNDPRMRYFIFEIKKAF